MAVKNQNLIHEGIKHMLMLVFWAVTPFGLVERYQRFGKKYCLHI
jgi:hypothetical protein